MKQKSQTPEALALRRRATKQLLEQSPAATEPVEQGRILHELQVYQLELELQNEELWTARQRLELENQRYMDLFDFAPVGYFTCDREGVVSEANLACASLLGVERRRLVGSSLVVFVAASDRKCWRAFLEECLDSPNKEHCELTFLVESGVAFEAQLEALRTEEGTSIRAAIWDVTERKQAEMERLQLNKLETTGILAGGIAHDFNNLLTAILVNLELGRESEHCGQELQPCLDRAITATNRASELTRQFLTVASADEPRREVTHLGAILEESVRLALSGSTLDRRVSCPGELWPVEVDVGQLAQVIRNLVQNAREAMPNGGVLSVSAENLLRTEDTLPNLLPGPYVRVNVADTGGGIAMETLPRIFDPYFSTKTRGEQKGMGLGLAVCHSIVQKHNGSLSVTSTRGKGTTFVLELPASERSAVTPDAIRREMAGHALRLLLVEEEAWVRKALGETLRQMGHEVELAEREEEAAAVFREALREKRAFDVVLLDLSRRQGADRTVTLGQLRAADPNAKVVILCGTSPDPFLQDYHRLGYNAALAKPFDLFSLRAALAGALGE